MAKTSLYNKHVEYKGKIVDFSGWDLPVDYGSALKEAKTVRTNCGVFDASHMGEIVVSGPKALDCLSAILSNDLAKLQEGRMQYNLLFDDKGHVLDDLMVYKRASDYFCVVNAANIDKDFKYIQKACGLDCNVINVSDTLSLICVQGPSSEKVLRDIAGDEVTFLKYMAFGEFEIKGSITALISRSGYTGEDGFEIYVDNNYSEALWDKIFQAGDDYGILPCGLASRDILRIEAGYPLYGHELFDEVNPFEVSIKWALKNLNDKICGLELESLSKKAANIRVGIVLTDKGVLRQGCKVFSGGQFIGEITSGTFSSNLDRSIGMAFISKEYNVHNEKVFVDIRGRKVQAVITGLPFIPANTKR